MAFVILVLMAFFAMIALQQPMTKKGVEAGSKDSEISTHQRARRRACPNLFGRKAREPRGTLGAEPLTRQERRRRFLRPGLPSWT